MTIESISEAERMRRVPGIIFADGPTGRRARIAGTGLDVFEIINAYRCCHENRDGLAEAFDWLTLEQIDAALTYYATFPEEIDARLRALDELTPESVRAEHPLRPSSQRGTGRK